MLGDQCDKEKSVCVAEFSECKDDGSNSGKDRCQCMSGYQSYTDSENEKFCGE